MANNGLPPVRVKAVHVHLSSSTPRGLERVAAILRALQSMSQDEAAAPIEPAPVEPAEEAQSCSICRSNSADCKLPCGCTYHRACITPWLISNSTCAGPYCDSFYVPDDLLNL
ncbi:probable E3 ubiquitin-protein ligase ATL44 [Thrips palmi]|uniref:Probable E3 ubiquitin-protein ligase ATL44 n=1 Tax=Thrips palmi TaxID=161013 RepID=A0A6P8ZJN7_THRPL|nr:probable E3 ubiquitin-protein ligase ATL44 [Thrips palmi]